MSNVLDIYDHEVQGLLDLQEKLQERAKAKRHNYNDFEREIKDEFAAIGFTVNVNWNEYAIGGVRQEGAMPTITVTGRVDKKFVFDPDRQVYEAVHDVLGLGESGWIKTDPETLKRFTDGQGGHGHGHHH